MTSIDASIVAKYILKEPNWQQVDELFETRDCISLDLMLIEVSNVIWKHQRLLSDITEEVAREHLTLLQYLSRDVLIIENAQVFLIDALELSMRERIPIYDSLYIVQALNTGLLVTSDKKQKNIAEKEGVAVILIE